MDIISSTRNITRVLGISAAVISAGGFSLVSAHSVDVTGGNSVTGPSSLNRNIHTIVNNDTSRFNLRGTATNTISGNLNSGDNTVRNNTLAGSVMGGDIGVRGSYSNDINTGTSLASVSDVSNDVSADLGNSYTGPNSSNDNRLNVRNTTNRTVNMDARINNNVRLNTDSGHNTATNNTVVGDVSSGSQDISLSFDNTANHGNVASTLGTVNNTFTGRMENNVTGPNSSNTNTVNVTNNTNQTVNQTANINNNFNVTANSGHNNVSGNTEAGNLSSGNITIDLSATNSAN